MSVAALRARFARLAQEARRATAERLPPLTAEQVSLSEVSSRALEAATLQWQSVYYDWPEVLRRFPGPDRIDAAVWGGQRLVVLGLAVIRGEALWIEVIEGDRADDVPLRGTRVAILLDAFANYAQLRERWELRLEAKNDRLATYYEASFGFERVLSKGNVLYWRRRLR